MSMSMTKRMTLTLAEGSHGHGSIRAATLPGMTERLPRCLPGSASNQNVHTGNHEHLTEPRSEVHPVDQLRLNAQASGTRISMAGKRTRLRQLSGRFKDTLT